jgi:DNA ligase-1
MRGCLALLLSILLAAPVVAVAAQPPPLMLATHYAPGLEVGDYWVSEKFDGVRGRWDGRALWTRGGHRVPAPEWFVAGWPRVPMDGELWIGRGRFDEVSALVRAREVDDAAWRRVRFMVFDLPAHEGGFSTRLQQLRVLLARAGIAWLQPVAQQRLADAQALEARLQAVVAAGGEGLMLHHREARYRAGRSDGLLKLKTHDDAEARVVGHTPGRGKYAGMLGALVVERPDGVRFRLGSGFSDAQRAAPPPPGSHVTYRYSGLTSKGLPRFARFLRVRDEMPPPDPPANAAR